MTSNRSGRYSAHISSSKIILKRGGGGGRCVGVKERRGSREDIFPPLGEFRHKKIGGLIRSSTLESSLTLTTAADGN